MIHAALYIYSTTALCYGNIFTFPHFIQIDTQIWLDYDLQAYTKISCISAPVIWNHVCMWRFYLEHTDNTLKAHLSWSSLDILLTCNGCWRISFPCPFTLFGEGVIPGDSGFTGNNGEGVVCQTSTSWWVNHVVKKLELITSYYNLWLSINRFEKIILH